MQKGIRPVESISRVSHSLLQVFFYIFTEKYFYLPDEKYVTAHTFPWNAFFVLIRHRRFTRDTPAFIFSVHKTFVFAVVFRAYAFNLSFLEFVFLVVETMLLFLYLLQFFFLAWVSFQMCTQIVICCLPQSLETGKVGGKPNTHLLVLKLNNWKQGNTIL